MRAFWTPARGKIYACILFVGAIAADRLRANWPKEGTPLPDFQIVKFGDGEHMDQTFTGPTFVLISGKNVHFGSLTFKNQDRYRFPGAITVRPGVTNLEFINLSVKGGSWALYVRREATNMNVFANTISMVTDYYSP